MKIMGIDEAGKGPVIGPMSISAAIIDEKDLNKLESKGIKDSKKINPTDREKIYKIIKKNCITHTTLVQAVEIDNAIASSSSNMVYLEADKTAQIINNHNPHIVYLDCPSVNIQSYKTYLKNKLLNKKTKLVCEHKADEKYLIVSAASIIAKVDRDSEIEKIKKKTKIDFGSGYMSDEKTEKFLKENWNNEEFIPYLRHSWESVKRLKEASKQKGLGDFIETEKTINIKGKAPIKK